MVSRGGTYGLARQKASALKEQVKPWHEKRGGVAFDAAFEVEAASQRRVMLFGEWRCRRPCYPSESEQSG